MGLLRSKSGLLWVQSLNLAHCLISVMGSATMNLAYSSMLSIMDSATMNLAHHLMLSIMGSSTVNWAPYSKLDSLWVRHQEWISAWVRSVSCEIQHQSYSVESNMGHGHPHPCCLDSWLFLLGVLEEAVAGRKLFSLFIFLG